MLLCNAWGASPSSLLSANIWGRQGGRMGSRLPAPPGWAAHLPCTGARPGRGQVWPQPPGGQGRGSVLSGLSPSEPTALGCAQSHPALSLPSRRGFQAGMPLPVRPRAAPPGTALHKAPAPLAAEEASWSPSLSEWEGGEQLKGSPEGNFQKNQPASGIWPCKKCFPSPWLSERGLHVVETSLIPGACKTGVKREDWESLWLRV